MRSVRARWSIWIVLMIAGTGCGPGGGGTDGGIPTPTLHTPRWAFEPWISKDISDGADTRAFVQGFRERDIPVGVVVLDSPWETHYNTFVPNPARYPEFDRLVADLHADGIRIVLLVTQMINEISMDLEEGGDAYDGPAPNLAEAERRGYLVNGGERTWWWKGLGAGLDFFHPEAVAWWHGQQNALLALGLDGWKLDFGENYLGSDPLATFAGERSLQAYSEEYYRDFLAYGVFVRGPEFLTMVRPYDKSYEFEGRFFARPEHAPVAWVGDNRRDWVGLLDALDHLFRSAQAGYAVIGSDIGGYLDRDDVDMTTLVPFDVEVFARWVALGALCPFMQLHGRANLAPWTVPERTDEVVALYRYWATLHHELVPFFYSLAAEAATAGAAVLHPLGAGPAEWEGDWRFEVSSALLVAPLFAPGSRRDVLLPAGGEWFDWWSPDQPPITGGTRLVDHDVIELGRIPLFVRQGAIVPAYVSSDLTGLGTEASAGHLTVLLYPDETETTFSLHDADDRLTRLRLQRVSGRVEFDVDRLLQPAILRLPAAVPPAAVTRDGRALAHPADRTGFDAAAEGWWHEPDPGWLWVKLETGGGVEVEIE